MKKKTRLAILTLAGVLAYFASVELGTAYPLCHAACWDSGGRTCCTTEDCFDYCW
jgi:hypothetical protein